MAIQASEKGETVLEAAEAAAAAAPSADAAAHHLDLASNDNLGPHSHALARLRASAARRRLQRAWRSFHCGRSSELARAFVATGVLGGGTTTKDDGGDGDGEPEAAATAPAPSPAVFGVGFPGNAAPALSHRASADGVLASDFDDLAEVLMLPSTLKAARALLARLEARVALRPREAHAGVVSSHGKLMASFARRKSGGGGGSASSSPAKPSTSSSTSSSLPPLLPGGRYPLRVFLSSLMMVEHPEVVFRSANGEKERQLRAAASELRGSLVVLLAALISSSSSPTPLPCALSEALSSITPAASIAPPSRSLSAFDASWAKFLDSFVSWKAADAAALEADLVRAAVELEGSRLAIEAGALAAAAEAADAASSPSPEPSSSSPEAATAPPRPRRAQSPASAPLCCEDRPCIRRGSAPIPS